MIKYLWRETLASFLLIACCIYILGTFFAKILMPNKVLLQPILILTFIGIFIISLLYLRKIGLSNNAFIEILKNNCFVAEYKIVSRVLGFKFWGFIGLRDDGILIRASFDSWRYWPSINEWIRGTGSAPTNLSIYFPCRKTALFNHYIVKVDNKVKIGHHLYLPSDQVRIVNIDSDLSKILSEMCADIDFLVINRIQAGQGFILIETGPESLAYGEYVKKNIPAVLKFIQAFRTYYGCQDDKWDRPIDMSNLKENIDALNKEFVHSLREKNKSHQ